MLIADKLFNGDTLDTREVGIEIEVEGENLPQNTPMGWRREHDGSLRGESAEYVLRKPIPRAKVEMMLDRLISKFDSSQVFDTGRAGVHIHINIRDLTEVQLYNFICLYLVFEDTLVDYCGEARVGNLFCLRAKDAEYLLELVEAAAIESDLRILHTDAIRYASINCKAICEYGSLEFRAMRSTVDKEVLLGWTGMLLRLKDMSKMFTDPRDIVSTMSWEGGEEFAKKIFGEILSYFPANTDWELCVLEGIRQAQTIAYAGNWKEKENVVPF